MSEFSRALFALIVAVAPFGALPLFAAYLRDVTPRMRIRGSVIAGVISIVMLAATIVISDPFLDWIEVSPENFQIAAGVIMGPIAIRLLITGDAMTTPDETNGPMPPRAWLVPIAFPLIAGPASLAAALSYGTRFGEGEVILAAGIAAAIGAATSLFAVHILRAIGKVPANAFGRLNGALMMVIIVELMIDGIQSV